MGALGVSSVPPGPASMAVTVTVWSDCQSVESNPDGIEVWMAGWGSSDDGSGDAMRCEEVEARRDTITLDMGNGWEQMASSMVNVIDIYYKI